MSAPFDNFNVDSFGRPGDNLFIVRVVVAHLLSDALGDGPARCREFIENAIQEKLDREREK